MDDVDRVGRIAAAKLSVDVDRRVDVDAALHSLFETSSTTSASVVELGRDARRGRVLVVAAVAAAVVALVVSGLLIGRSSTKHVVPVDRTTETTDAPTSSTQPAGVLPSSPPTTPTTAVGSDIQKVSASVDEMTPVIEGEPIYSSAIANTHPWFAAVTPAGRLFIGPSDGTSAKISEIVDGQPIDTGITSNGDLRSALDERLYSIDWTSHELAAWAQDNAGKWSVDATANVIGDCGFTAQPDAARCGQAVIPIEPSVEAPALEWSGLQLTATSGDQVSRWALSLDSAEASISDCTDGQCLAAWRAGDVVAWTPVLDQTPRFGSRLAVMLRPHGPPATAWLHCGGDCRIIGANDGYLYTIGYGIDATGTADVVARRFRTDLGSAQVDLPADLLANWPPPPEDHPSLGDVPLLFPTALPVEAAQPVRREYADAASLASRFTQIYFSEKAQATMVIETRLGSPPPDQTGGDDVQLAPWDRATFARVSSGHELLQLVDPSGYVTISSRGLNRDQLSAVARSLWRPQNTSTSWRVDYLPAGMMSMVQGWSLGTASRTITWSKSNGSQAELVISHGTPGLFLTPLFDGTSVEGVEVGSAGGGLLYRLQDGRSAVVWSPSTDVYAMVASSDPHDDVVRIARSMHEVDQATWMSSSTIAASTDDGCSSLFC